MGKFFKSFFIGIGIGLAATAAAYVLGLVVEILGCACHIFTCNWNAGSVVPFLWNGNMFLTILLVCGIGGAVIGGLVGVIRAVSENNQRKAEAAAYMSEQAIKHRKENAVALRKTASDMVTDMRSANESASKYSETTQYYLGEMSESAWKNVNRFMNGDAELSLFENYAKK